MGIRHIELPDETGLDYSLAQFFDVVGLDFQPDGSSTSQELACIGNIPIEKGDIEVFSQAKEVSFGICYRNALV